jgi:hypothetical protein
VSMPNADILDFIIKTGLLWFFALSLFFPLGMFAMLLAAKRILFHGFSFQKAWEGWIAEQHARTQIETKLEERITDLDEQLKQIVSANWDSRRYFDTVLERTANEHKQILTYLENILLLARKRKTDWIREPETEMFLQQREWEKKS